MPQTTILALLGGLIPSLIWLWFWLKEDSLRPEPRMRIFLTFCAGMGAVAVVMPLEEWALSLSSGVLTLFLWAIIEESLKLLAAVPFGLASKDYDEPVDAVIYLVTAALGFAAAENALFLLGPLQSDSFLQGFITGDLRFIGATLLHVLSSGTIGLFLAFSFHRGKVARFDALTLGLILAIILHTLFNFFILETRGAMTFTVFLAIWVGIVAVLFFLERAKHSPQNS